MVCIAKYTKFISVNRFNNHSRRWTFHKFRKNRADNTLNPSLSIMAY